MDWYFGYLRKGARVNMGIKKGAGKGG